mgnify:CR=1 FL=1
MSKGPNKKPDQTGQPRTPGLSEEDLLLWQHMARSLRPFHGRDKRILPGGFDEPGFTPHASQARPESPGSPHRSDESIPPRPAAPRKSESFRTVPELAKFDTGKARKIRAGRIDIEARLDLHGMRQSEAHGALRSFLLRSQARQLKWVLVITGKGTFARDGEHPDPLGGDWDAPPRGVLRRNVPIWLSEPELRAVVVSYTPAAVHHGGDGALYIQLRSNKK